jgi:hypothetical protein
MVLALRVKSCALDIADDGEPVQKSKENIRTSFNLLSFQRDLYASCHMETCLKYKSVNREPSTPLCGGQSEIDDLLPCGKAAFRCIQWLRAPICRQMFVAWFKMRKRRRRCSQSGHEDLKTVACPLSTSKLHLSRADTRHKM